MCVFLQHGYQNSDKLLSLNWCRMYLWAFWLSDLCNSTSNCIDYSIWHPHALCQSHWNWPQLITPLTMDWRLWQLALSSSLHLSHSQHLVNPLGPWLPSPSPFGWYFEPTTDHLWQVDTSSWEFVTPILHWTQNQLYHPNGIGSLAPSLSTLSKVAVSSTGNHWKLTGHGASISTFPTRFGIVSFWTLHFVKDWEFDFQIVGSWEALVCDVMQGQGFAVSDGSFKPQQGAATWILDGASSDNRVVSKCFVPGHDDDHSSFCSELTGIYSCLLFCNTAAVMISWKNLPST